MRHSLVLAFILTAGGCATQDIPPAWTPNPQASASACRAHAGLQRLTLMIHGLD